jgi:hypothetical protein
VGIARLLSDYFHSDLKRLHLAMDKSLGDQPEHFPGGYHKYRDIANQTKHPDKIYNLIVGANQRLLEPENLNYFVREIYNSWSDQDNLLAAAPHVAGLLRAIYEDPRFRWGHRWTKQTDALRYARGWVTIIMGQAFDNKNG